MAKIYPFRAFRYNPEKAGVPLDKLVTQPYDKITAAMQERYYQLSPHNLVRLVRGKTESGDNGNQNWYQRAARSLDEWTRAGILAQDPRPAFYPCFQEYSVPGTEVRHLRKGFIALGQLEDYAAGIVHRHEQTLSGPKLDRLELLRHTRTHFGQIFMIYSDPAGEVDKVLEEIARRETPQQVTDEYHAVHRLWRVDDPARVQRIQALLKEKNLIIADGHHRYETALAYRDDCRAKTGRTDPEAPYEKVMMTFINMEGTGVTILPTHRVVANLPEFNSARFREAASQLFDWYAYPFEGARPQAAAPRLLSDLANRGRLRNSFGVYAAGEPALYLFLLKTNAELAKELPQVSPRQRSLDLIILHQLLLGRYLGLDEESVRKEKNLSYLREWKEALDLVQRREAQLAFLVNPIRVDQVRDVAFAGEVLPQKSTDFYPKLLSGLAIYRLDA
jgi:uncharacterized protein (DUF1015 family)